jgi:hypothetical protein
MGSLSPRSSRRSGGVSLSLISRQRSRQQWKKRGRSTWRTVAGAEREEAADPKAGGEEDAYALFPQNAGYERLTQ